MASLASCADRASDAESAASLSALVTPHVDRIARFDRWAHRVASASGAWRTRSALEETTFSQVRTDPAVLAAWIERTGEAPLSYPAERALPDAPLRAVQLPPLGAIRAATGTVDHAGTPTSAVIVVLDHDGLRTTLALVRTP